LPVAKEMLGGPRISPEFRLLLPADCGY
jgi:hypothetical protein